MARLHPVFNVTKLTLAPPDPIPGRYVAPQPDPVIVDGEERYVVEEVIDSRLWRRKLQYLIKWEGYDHGHNSWENATDVFAPERVADFHARHPTAPRVVRGLRSEPVPERIVGSRFCQGRPQYLVKWLGCPSDLNSWEPADGDIFLRQADSESTNKRAFYRNPTELHRRGY